MAECIGNTPLETKYNTLGRTKEIKIRERNKQKESSEIQVRRPRGEGVIPERINAYSAC